MTQPFTGFLDLSQGFSWIEGFTNFEKKPIETREYRLDRMVALLELFDNPHTKRPSIHIAGSKGKGSIATLLSNGLAGLGFRPGLYRSPHIEDYRERITLNGQFFPESAYLSKITSIKALLDDNPQWIEKHGQPTTFELLTLLGFLLFMDQDCDIYVLETGLGGRLDATNVVEPLFSVITTLELEHTEILGPTLIHIAKEKAGIIKTNRPVFIFPQQALGMDTLESIAKQRNATCYYPLGPLAHDLPEFSNLRITWEGIQGGYDGITYRSTIPGVMHLWNCVFVTKLLSLALSQNLFQSLPRSSIVSLDKNQEHSIMDLLAQVSIPGRMEILSIKASSLPGHPIAVVLDGAHTPYSIAILIKNLHLLLNQSPGHKNQHTDLTQVTMNFGCLLAISQGKNVDGILDLIVPEARWVIISSPGFFKTSNPKEVFEQAQKKLITHSVSKKIILEIQPEKALDLALRMAKSDQIPLVVTGSFYLLGEVKGHLKSHISSVTQDLTIGTTNES
jgi:dihydrofolate synthase/folylpolyglutamate synthase